jgi:hypothetical protein
VLELVHPTLDPLHRTFYLVHLVTNIPLEGVVLVGELGRGGGFGSVACLRGIVRDSMNYHPPDTLEGHSRTSVPLGLRGSLLSYPIFMPKSCTRHMHDLGSILPPIWPKVFTDKQMSQIRCIYYIDNVSKD